MDTTNKITLNSDLKRLFSWLTRVEIGRKFGTLPIGWYQMHQCGALDYLGGLLRNLEFSAGQDTPLRVRRGHVQARGERGWITLCSTVEAFQQADNRARA